MRLLSILFSALALIAFLIASASACSWSKSADSQQMTVADTSEVPQVDTDISLATNDLSDDVLLETDPLPVPVDEPTE
ncbi:hypothetical protein ABLO27_12170 [Roseibium sp. SCPC15]|uniref:hypothetical protein n=1 Tax=Roseibium sp. SCP15 TaxID=3141376 RepID=UPI003335452E